METQDGQPIDDSKNSFFCEPQHPTSTGL